MTLQSPFLGEIQVEADKVITFPTGLIGFSDRTKFLLIQWEEDLPFWYLQSTEDENLFFLLVEPTRFFPDYQVNVSKEDLKVLALDGPEQGVVLNLVSVPEGDIQKATVNLQGPLVINPDERLGKQVVLHPSPYTTKHPLFQDRGDEDQEPESRSSGAL